MALSQEDKILVGEYVFAGILAREVADRLLSGRITKTENSLFKSLVRTVGRAAGRQALRMGGTVAGAARTHPLITLGVLTYIAHTRGVTIDTARAIAEQEYEASRRQPQFFLEEQLKERIREFEPTVLPGGGLGRGQPAASRAVRRKISRANTAVKQGMKWLKAGTKAATGAVPGVLPTRAFRTTVIAAGMANPKTKSKPGKGKSIMNKLARRLKKWW